MAKILWVIHGGEVYGESRAIWSLMRGVRDSGWQAEAISLTQGGCYERLEAEMLPVACLGMRDSPGIHLSSSRAGKIWQAMNLAAHQIPVSRRVRAEIRARRPDVVHVLDKNILPAVAWAARREGVPCFWEMTAIVGTGYPLDFNRRLYRWLLRNLHIHPLANSQYTAQTLGDIGRPVDVMLLGADSRRFDPHRSFAITRQSAGIPENALVYLILSRIEQPKGQAIFLQAMLKVADPRMHLVLVGGGTKGGDIEVMRQLVAQQGAEKFVHFAGFTPEPEGYLTIADVAVNSRIDAEPFGLAVVEAMMMGKPVLAHALGGPGETILDAKTGWLVTEPTIDSFAEGIRRSIADRDRWKQMGDDAHLRAITMFSLKEQTRRYREIAERHIAELK